MPNPLSKEEYLKVQRVTRYESYSHRRWPQDVVRTIANAEIIPTAGVWRPAGSSRVEQRRLKDSRLRLHLGRWLRGLRSQRTQSENLALNA